MVAISSSVRRLFLTGVLFVIPLVLGGCGKADKECNVKGLVTLDGAPVETGSVVFRGEKGTDTAFIQPGGTINIIGAKTGSVQACVKPPPVTRGMKMKPFRVPKKYQDFGTSGLSYDLKGGDNEVAIDMTSK
jgi:hypothetical protein